MNNHKLKFILFVVLVIGAVVSAKLIGFEKLTSWMNLFCDYVRGLGFAGMLLYAVAYGAASLLAIPVMPLTIAAGLVFGFWGGVFTALLGAAIGGGSGFLISRYLARDEVADKLKGHPKFLAIDAAVGSEGWKIIGLLRMCPFPFGLSNYLYGLTSIQFWPYLAATIAGVLPSVCLFVYFGQAGKLSLETAGKGTHQPPGVYIMLVVGLIAGLAAMIFVGRIARAAVAKATGSGPAVVPGKLTEVDDKSQITAKINIDITIK